jgi:hypothetical protein
MDLIDMVFASFAAGVLVGLICIKIALIMWKKKNG